MVHKEGESHPANPLEERGTLTICPEVLEEIVCTELRHTEGVVPPLESVMHGMLRRHVPYGARLEISNGEVVVHLTVGVRGGMRIPDVAATARQRIASAVHAKTGYRVHGVHIRVDHVAFDEGSRSGS